MPVIAMNILRVMRFVGVVVKSSDNKFGWGGYEKISPPKHIEEKQAYQS